MKILLVDADSKIPNLALMKLSTHYKSIGFNVDLIQLHISYYPNRRKPKVVDASEYDMVFVSAIFFETKNYLSITGCNKIEYGGTGYSIEKQLPPYIDKCEYDYSIYPNNDTSYGFITRGCVRDCWFCVVPEKEGLTYQVSDVDSIVKHKKVKFLDNNFLSWKNHKEVLQELIDKNIHFQFNQGLDIRLINNKNAELLAKSKYLGEYIFAFDDIASERVVTRGLNIFKSYFDKDFRIKFFVYCDATLPIKDVIYRIEWCRDNKVLPYLMRNLNCWDSDNKDFYIDLAAYCNQPNIFKKMNPKEYIEKRQSKNIERQIKFLTLYEENNI